MPKCAGVGGLRGPLPMSTAVKMEPNKLRRANSIFKAMTLLLTTVENNCTKTFVFTVDEKVCSTRKRSAYQNVSRSLIKLPAYTCMGLIGLHLCRRFKYMRRGCVNILLLPYRYSIVCAVKNPHFIYKFIKQETKETYRKGRI